MRWGDLTAAAHGLACTVRHVQPIEFGLSAAKQRDAWNRPPEIEETEGSIHFSGHHTHPVLRIWVNFEPVDQLRDDDDIVIFRDHVVIDMRSNDV